MTMGRIWSLAIAAIGAFALATPPASAQTSPASGKINNIILSGAWNYAFRIILDNNGANPLSGCTYNFGYMNAADDNYQAKVAGLLAAFASRKTVYVWFTRDSGNACRIYDYTVFPQ